MFVKKISVDILAKQASDMASEHIDAMQKEMDIEKLQIKQITEELELKHQQFEARVKEFE